MCSSRSASRSPPAAAPRSALVRITEVPEPFERQRCRDASAAAVAGVVAPRTLVAGTQARLHYQLVDLINQQSQRLVGVLEATLDRRGGGAGAGAGASSSEVALEEMTVASDGSWEIATHAKPVEEPAMHTATPAALSSPTAPAAAAPVSTSTPMPVREAAPVASSSSAASPPTMEPSAIGARLPMPVDELQGLRAEIHETAEETVASMRHQLQALLEEQRLQLNQESSLVSQVSLLREELHGGGAATIGAGDAAATRDGSSPTARGGNEEEGPLLAELRKRIADLEHTVKVQGEENAQQAVAYTELNLAVLLDRERQEAQHDRDAVKEQQALTVQALTVQAELAQIVAREREALDAERKSHSYEVAQLRSELETLAEMRPPPLPPPCKVLSSADDGVTTNDGSARKSHQFSIPGTRESSFATEERSTPRSLPASCTRSGTPHRPAVIESPSEAAARWYKDSMASVWKPAPARTSGPIICRIDGEDIDNAARKVERLKREFADVAVDRTLSAGQSTSRSGGPGNALESRKLGDVDISVDEEFADVGEELIRVPAQRAAGGPGTLSPFAARPL